MHLPKYYYVDSPNWSNSENWGKHALTLSLAHPSPSCSCVMIQCHRVYSHQDDTSRSSYNDKQQLKLRIIECKRTHLQKYDHSAYLGKTRNILVRRKTKIKWSKTHKPSPHDAWGIIRACQNRRKTTDYTIFRAQPKQKPINSWRNHKIKEKSHLKN